ncbi:unnamed protein product [Polarella glacialis]|uniref:Uncharacterized protein n=1 Tax=Polarella glacialis TaxID=89957 RepID=A0A813GJ24_POLGL|nr:unnamed protein product [Polarella glacialis]
MLRALQGSFKQDWKWSLRMPRPLLAMALRSTFQSITTRPSKTCLQPSSSWLREKQELTSKADDATRAEVVSTTYGLLWPRWSSMPRTLAISSDWLVRVGAGGWQHHLKTVQVSDDAALCAEGAALGEPISTLKHLMAQSGHSCVRSLGLARDCALPEVE